MPLNCSICSAALNLRFRQDKINHPEEYISNWDEYTEQHKNGLIKHWNKEIYNFQQSIRNRVDELKERGEYDERGQQKQ